MNAAVISFFFTLVFVEVIVFKGDETSSQLQ